jgi:outer membrane protein assembly factor BamB
VVDGVVYVGSNDTNLYALDRISGKLLWGFSTKGNISASPVVSNRVIYIGSYDSTFYALKSGRLDKNKVYVKAFDKEKIAWGGISSS